MVMRKISGERPYSVIASIVLEGNIAARITEVTMGINKIKKETEEKNDSENGEINDENVDTSNKQKKPSHKNKVIKKITITFKKINMKLKKSKTSGFFKKNNNKKEEWDFSEDKNVKRDISFVYSNSKKCWKTKTTCVDRLSSVSNFIKNQLCRNNKINPPAKSHYKVKGNFYPLDQNISFDGLISRCLEERIKNLDIHMVYNEVSNNSSDQFNTLGMNNNQTNTILHDGINKILM